MIIVYVKHYLNKEGRAFVREHWFSMVKRLMQQQSGYISFKHKAEQDYDDCVNLVVTFDNEINLQHWVDIKEHDKFVNMLDDYRSRDYWEVAKTRDENAAPATLNWKKIRPKYQ
jgi:antibiotic biosynthesis monooxygenase (ABM) superfamily enzyme